MLPGLAIDNLVIAFADREPRLRKHWIKKCAHAAEQADIDDVVRFQPVRRQLGRQGHLNLPSFAQQRRKVCQGVGGGGGQVLHRHVGILVEALRVIALAVNQIFL